jgi:hypothetical protein
MWPACGFKLANPELQDDTLCRWVRRYGWEKPSSFIIKGLNCLTLKDDLNDP